MSVHDRVKQALGDGLLSFPITDFDQNGKFDEVSYRARLHRFIEHPISAVFVAGGTGEFFSLSFEEYKKIVTIAVEVVAGKVPVIASAGRSVPEAVEYCNFAESAGIDGILLMPPYLTGCPSEGLVEYTSRIMKQSRLPFIYYNRANGSLKAPALKELTEQCDNFIALKDGVGNLDSLNVTIKTIGDRLTYIGGIPTAEMMAEAYLSIGVNTYSSAVFNFMPEMALKFYSALRAGEHETVNSILEKFFIPFCRLRDQKAGYAVSLIKAGAAIQGHPAGDVRAPLTMPKAEELKTLENMIKANQS